VAPHSGQSLEETLLKDLLADPLDEDVHRELFAPEQQPADPASAKDRLGEPTKDPDKAAEDLDKRLGRELGPAAVSEEESPLLEVARQMRSAEARLGRSDCGPATQNVQDEIVARLEELLKQARCGGSAASQPTQSQSQQVASRRPVDQPKQRPGEGVQKTSPKPVRNPQTRAGSSAAQHPDMGQMRDLLKQVWGELPPGQREQMLQCPVEEFLPKYELLIEAYFKRLAEQQEVDRWPANSSQSR